jgi:hypothetical protein
MTAGRFEPAFEFNDGAPRGKTVAKTKGRGSSSELFEAL